MKTNRNRKNRQGDPKRKQTKASLRLKDKKSAAPRELSHAPTEELIRLNRFIANSGRCSRREADMHIGIGNVSVNGKVITRMGYKVKRTDEVRFDGVRLVPEKKKYILLNKPKGFTTSISNGKARSVLNLIPESSNLEPISRLGANSLGLVLLTNDEVLRHKLVKTKKAASWLYYIQLDSVLKSSDMAKIKAGVTVKKNLIKVEEINYTTHGAKDEVGLKIKHAGTAVLKNLFDHLGYGIKKIDCVAIAHLNKKDLPRGRWRSLTELEISTLKMY